VAQLRTARSRIAAKEQQLFQELTIAVAQQVAAEARLEVAASTASAAAENAELTEQRYRLGVASAIEQADAQSAVTSARAEQIKARCDRWLAFADIARLTGASQPSERMPNDKTAVGGKAKP
jgi:outer membrane protein TolC